MDLHNDPSALAAKQLFDGLVVELRDSRGVHAETALAAAGALLGEELLRQAAAQAQMPLSERVPGSEIYVAGTDASIARMGQYIVERCELLGLSVNADADIVVPPEGTPHERPAELARRLRRKACEALACHCIAPEESPLVFPRVIAALLWNTSHVLDTAMGLAIATQALVEASQRVPLAEHDGD